MFGGGPNDMTRYSDISLRRYGGLRGLRNVRLLRATLFLGLASGVVVLSAIIARTGCQADRTTVRLILAGVLLSLAVSFYINGIAGDARAIALTLAPPVLLQTIMALMSTIRFRRYAAIPTVPQGAASW